MKTYAAPKRRNIVHLLNRLRNAPTAINGIRRPGPSVEEFDDLLEDTGPDEGSAGNPQHLGATRPQ
jgi:hypothetical protein